MKVAIFGAGGAIGHSAADALEQRGVPFRVVGRNRARLESAFGGRRGVEIFPADLAEPREAEAAARGADSIVYSVGVPYTRFDLHPKLMRTAIEAATAAQVRRMVVVSSVYSYGVPQTDRVAETHPRDPQAFKGKMRKEQEDVALEAHRSGLLEMVVVRLPDFYGPHADQSLGNMILRAAVDGRAANWLGTADLPHEFLYVPDAGPVIADLATRDDCAGEAWNLGGAGVIRARDFIALAFQAAGRKPKWRTAGKPLLRMMGWFNPLMRELVEMFYLQTRPVILNDDKLAARLENLPRTSYAEGIRHTVDWMRSSNCGS